MVLASDERRRASRVEVVDEENWCMWRVPANLVAHLPKATRLLICREYLHDGHCPKGVSCPRTHVPSAALTGSTREPVHINAPAGHVLHHTASVLPPGRVLHVALSSDRDQTEAVDSGRVLVTKGSVMLLNALDGNDDRLNNKSQHCVHFHSHGACHRGPRCYFIHALPGASWASRVWNESSSPIARSPFALSEEEASSLLPMVLGRPLPAAQLFVQTAAPLAT